MVRGEGKPGSEIGSIDWIDVRTLAPQFKKYLEFDLDEGEAETIALSEGIGADLVLIDELLNRGFWISTELCNAVLREAGEW